MKCPKCGAEKCYYIDRDEVKDKDGDVIGYKRKRASDGTTDSKKNELVRQSDVARCNKCKFEGVI